MKSLWPRPTSEEVFGHRIARPRPTPEGLRLALVYGAAPTLALLLLLDLVVWAIAEAAFGACVAIWCVF